MFWKLSVNLPVLKYVGGASYVISGWNTVPTCGDSRAVSPQGPWKASRASYALQQLEHRPRQRMRAALCQTRAGSVLGCPASATAEHRRCLTHMRMYMALPWGLQSAAQVARREYSVHSVQKGTAPAHGWHSQPLDP